MPPFRKSPDEDLPCYRFGWHGDNGLGEALIGEILEGRKSATSCPAYDPEEAKVGDVVRIVDKTGRTRGKIRIVRIETRRWEDFDEGVAAANGASSLAEFKRAMEFANHRDISPDEEMRTTYFRLLSDD